MGIISAITQTALPVIYPTGTVHQTSIFSVQDTRLDFTTLIFTRNVLNVVKVPLKTQLFIDYYPQIQIFTILFFLRLAIRRKLFFVR